MKNEWTRIIIGAIMALTGFIGYTLAFKYIIAASIDWTTKAWIFTGLILMVVIGYELVCSSTEEDEEDYDYVIYVKEK